MSALQIINLLRKRYKFVCGTTDLSKMYYLTFIDVKKGDGKLEIRKLKIYTHLEYLNILKKVEKFYDTK